MSLNYGIEPLWFRLGILPQAAFGNVAKPVDCGATPLFRGQAYGDQCRAHEVYSNGLAGGTDPATPVLQANAGQPARIRITNPFGTTRGSTFGLHGHVWQRDPYVCPDNVTTGDGQYGLTGKCYAPETGSLINPLTGTPLVGSTAIGNNPIGFAQGGQESWNAPTHFDIVLPSAGGGNNVDGDYLFRDTASFGNASGLWGILRVQ
jgi:hypothetical protein